MGGCFRGISGKGLQSVYVQEKRYLSDGRLRITRKPLINGKRKPQEPLIDKLGRDPVRSVGFVREPAVRQSESGGCLYLHFVGYGSSENQFSIFRRPSCNVHLACAQTVLTLDAAAQPFDDFRRAAGAAQSCVLSCPKWGKVVAALFFGGGFQCAGGCAC